MSLDGWAACGSCEAARFGEDVVASDSMDNERCLLRLLVGSFGVNEGELDGDGGVSIALVVVAEGKYENEDDASAAYGPEAPISRPPPVPAHRPWPPQDHGDRLDTRSVVGHSMDRACCLRQNTSAQRTSTLQDES